MSNEEVPGLKISGIKKSFGSLQAVKGLDFTVESRQIYALLGPNGAGKSTTLSIIAGLQKADEGRIIWNARQINPLDAQWKTVIGVCPQELVIYPNLTCMEQLIYTARLNSIDKKNAVQKSGILLEKLGLKDKSREKASRLSGGMKRRLNLALALVHDPKILILDEPEAGLDPQSRVLVRDFIKGYVTEKDNSRIVLYTTHNMDEAQRIADRVGIIDHGRLLAEGTCAELIRDHAGGQMVELEYNVQHEQRLFSGTDLAHVRRRKTANSIVFYPDNIEEFLVHVLAVMKETGSAMPHISIRGGDLEDVFINLTGRRLRE